MSVIGSNVLAGASGQSAGGGGGGGAAISRSLRFNASDSSFLSRTPSSAGIRKTWTWSGWVKISDIGTGVFSLFAAYDSSNTRDVLRFESNKLNLQIGTSGTYRTETTDALFRDPSAWYHIVVAFDSTQATAANRLKLYANGIEQSVTGTPVDQNTESTINNTDAHYIGARSSSGSAELFFNGYLADVHFIDGQALAPTDFGETNTNNLWVPKTFEGTYNATGTNYVSGTAGSPYSSGSTYTNALDGSTSTAMAAAASGTYTVNFNTISNITTLRIFGKTVSDTGTFTVNGNSYLDSLPHHFGGSAGWVTIPETSLSQIVIGTQSNGYEDAFIYAIEVNGSVLVETPSGVNGFHLDFADNSSNAALGTDTSGNSNTWTVNNLTASAPGLATANQGMDVVTWTGNGSDRDIGGLAFQPDFVWIKKRNSSSYGDHMLYDVVRGATKVLRSDNTAAEITDASTLDAFNSDGFSIGGGWEVNKSGDTYVSWAWKAGGAASSNTDGTITSSVSANNTYGFSIASWTSDGTDANKTIGHGLSSAPKFIIIKARDEARHWLIWHENFAGPSYAALFTDGAPAANRFGPNAPTSSVFGVYGGQGNRGTTDFIAYCWSEIIGFSKFGSYTGGTNPKTITTGFKPKYLLIKCTSASDGWFIVDAARGVTNYLLAESTNAESTHSGWQFDSDGFTLISTANGINASGREYIYAAYASKPSGEGIDSLFDTPINGDTASDTGAGGEITGCYATLNPLDRQSTNGTLSNGNLDLTSTGANWAMYRSTMFVSSGKWYWECTLGNNQYSTPGICTDVYQMAASSGNWVNGSTEMYGLYIYNGKKYNGDAGVAYATADTTAAGSVIGLALDLDNGTLTFYKDGASLGTAYSGLTGKNISPTHWVYQHSGVGNADAYNFGQRAFSYPVSGYKSLNTANLSSTIADGSQYFDAKLFTANASTQSISLGFAPDFVWLKSRANAYGNEFYDIIRGVNKRLTSNTTAAEQSLANQLTSFDSNGFTLGDASSSNYNSGTTSVGWAWDAGTGANPVGDIWQGSATKYIGVKFASASGGTVSYGQSSGSTTVEVWTSSNNSSWTQQGGTQTLSTGHTLTTSDQYVFIRNTSDATFTNWYAAATNGADGHYSSQTYPSGASWSGPSYTDYDWRADGGTLNNDGDILSIVRAQPSAGFSIVSYTGIGGIPKSIGHGLNSAPGLVIVKRRDAADDWPTYFISHTTFFLNTTANTVNNDQYHHGDYKPTSTLFTVGGNGAINANGGTYIAYCFASVEGYSKISNFQGNGSTDGTFVYTGFKPRFLLIKRYGVKAWQIIDTARSPFNVTDDRLFPSDSGAESSGSNFNLDILSNGFKCRTAHDSTNAASTYAYYAVAEHPFASNGGLAR